MPRAFEASLPRSQPSIRHRRPALLADKIRNVLNKGRNPTSRPSNATCTPRLRRAMSEPYSKAIACVRNDLDELLACFRYKTLVKRRTMRTANAIERSSRDVRRRPDPMGVFSDKTSILFAVFTRNQGVSSPLPLTQTY